MLSQSCSPPRVPSESGACGGDPCAFSSGRGCKARGAFQALAADAIPSVAGSAGFSRCRVGEAVETWTRQIQLPGPGQMGKAGKALREGQARTRGLRLLCKAPGRRGEGARHPAPFLSNYGGPQDARLPSCPLKTKEVLRSLVPSY